MASNKASCLFRSGRFKPALLRKGLPQAYAVTWKDGKWHTGIMLDTFEDHLLRSGHVLLQLQGRVVMLDLSAGLLLEQPVDDEWRFAEELKGGVVGLQLSAISRLRAFLPVCDLSLEQGNAAVLDELEKTVARARVFILSKGDRKATWVTLAPLRGYADEAGRVQRGLMSAGFAAAGVPEDFFLLLGIKRAHYTSRPEIPLDADAPVYASAGRIATTVLGVARANERGLIEDLDTEFVHDYRVSLRRVRSMLTLFKGVYSREAGRSLISVLAGIMKQTNRLRDLDVYLLDRDRYRKLVPASMHAGLDIMFDVFTRERQEVLEQVRSLLNSTEYDRQMKGLQKNFSDSEALPRGAAANESTLHFARRLIRRRYRKVAEIAAAIRQDTPDEHVHELRIQCKKLRYLMEFFMPLFPADQIRPLIKSLKGLQDVLGRFNDYSVQRESLAAFVEEHPMRGQKGIRLVECVGALVATLYQLQLQARGEVENSIAVLINMKTRRQFARALSNKD